jgi:hypothetical protein
MNIDKLKKKEKRTLPVVKRAREIQEWYKTHDVPTGDKKLVIDKLRAEYEKEAEELNKKQAAELQPLIEEYDKIMKDWKELLAKIKEKQKEIIEKGGPHEIEHMELSRKYVEMELQILRGGGLA